MKNKGLVISLALPIFVLISLVLKTEFDIKQGQKLKLEIAGYDPRDLLRGHYINFRYLWDFDEEKTQKFADTDIYDAFKEVEICIPSNRKVYPIKSSDKDSNCEFRILGRFIAKGNAPKPNFLLGIEKFYVPEKFSKLIEDELREKKGEIELSINSQRRAVILDLIINGVSWREITSR